MTASLKPDDITLASGTIHNPAEPRHFMKLVPIKRRVRIHHNGVLIADSTNAYRLVELSREIYEPVIYLPFSDTRAALHKTAKSSVCPLKGKASYFDLLADNGEILCEDIGWAYETPHDFAEELAGLIAFYPNRVTLEELPS